MFDVSICTEQTTGTSPVSTTVVPVPAAPPLLVGGLTVLGVVGYRRRKQIK